MTPLLCGDGESRPFRAWCSDETSDDARSYPHARDFGAAAEMHAEWLYRQDPDESFEITVTDGTTTMQFTVDADVEVSFNAWSHRPKAPAP